MPAINQLVVLRGLDFATSPHEVLVEVVMDGLP